MPDPISWAHSWPYFAVCFAAAYVLGSVPFGLLLSRVMGFGDIRKIGSGNIGTINVLRTGNKMLAALTLVLDAGKGAVAVTIAQAYGPDMAVTAAAAAVIGHMAPVWLMFRGGKGVATVLGALVVIAWPVGLLSCLGSRRSPAHRARRIPVRPRRPRPPRQHPPPHQARGAQN